MDNALDRDTAGSIAHNASAIVKLQGEIANAADLIRVLDSLPLGEATITVSTFVRQEPYSCAISNASAICLLRESIEMKQQYIKTLSDWLRSALNE
ncbi:MAG TPA: hypothetical protein VL866_24245 [Pyrinomonadaceae bacterium]|nr:hypothetical protein [Pyrinomonadaceae bacterium]